MRNAMHRRVKAMTTFIVMGGGLLACVGGGGSLSEAFETWESTPSSVERAARSERASSSPESAPRSQESARSSTEPAPGAQFGASGGGSNALVCSGRYVCQTAGKSDTDTVTLTSLNGLCSLEGFVLQPDGQLTRLGQTAGSWSTTGTGFTVTTTKGALTCTLVSGSSGSDSRSPGSSNSDPGPSPPNTEPSPKPPVDAGS